MAVGVPVEARSAPPVARPETTLEDRVLDAAKRCCERWGKAKTTVDDIATEAGCSRATVYRLFPGGRDNLYEALRAREVHDFFVDLAARLTGATDLEDLVVRGLVGATELLRHDEHLQLMLASEPGETAHELTVDGLPRIFESAAAFLAPWLVPHLGAERSAELAEWLSRLVVSYFLAPSAHVDLADPESATTFVRRFVLPAFAIAPPAARLAPETPSTAIDPVPIDPTAVDPTVVTPNVPTAPGTGPNAAP